LVLLGLAMLVVSRQRTRTVTRLAGAATDIAAGRRVVPTWRAADPAVAKLHAAFTSMSVAVNTREEQLRDQARVLGTLERAGASLASELHFGKEVQTVTDAGTHLTDAQFGAFFYNRTDQNGESDVHYTLPGVDG